MNKKLLVAALTAMSLVATGLFATSAVATDNVKVGICHRTASDSNPYVYIEVDENAVPAHLGNTLPGHKPTVWKTDGTFRGVAHVAGDAKDDYLAPNGAADCQDGENPPEPEEVTAGVQFIDPTCDTGASIVLDEKDGVLYETQGTVAPGESVIVTATADEGYELVGQSVFEHTFGEVPPDDVCNPPQGEASAALLAGTCTAFPQVILTNDTTEAVTFVVNGTEYVLEAGTQQAIEVQFGAVLVTVGETTLLDAFAGEPTNCGGTTPPPPDNNPPNPPNGLPETL